MKQNFAQTAYRSKENQATFLPNCEICYKNKIEFVAQLRIDPTEELHGRSGKQDGKIVHITLQNPAASQI